MSTLHLINHSPHERSAFDSCLRLAKAGSTLLLIEDGIYAAQQTGIASKQLNTALETHKVYALQADVEARGMSGKLHSEVELVDYDGFVKLTVEHDKVQSWL